MYRSVIALVLVFGVAACGSSTEPLTGEQIFAQRVDAAIEQDEAFRSNNIPILSSNDLPDTGGATYNGPIGVGIEDAANTFVVGDLTITTNFDPAEDLITGGADNFRSSEGEQFDGSLDISNSALGDPLGYGTGFTADIDGQLEGDTTGLVDVDGRLEGSFGTSRATPGPVSGVLGEVYADVETDQGTFKADGVFVAD